MKTTAALGAALLAIPFLSFVSPAQADDDCDQREYSYSSRSYYSPRTYGYTYYAPSYYYDRDRSFYGGSDRYYGGNQYRRTYRSDAWRGYRADYGFTGSRRYRADFGYNRGR